MNPILTAKTGSNASLLADCLDIYAKDGWTIADVTYGKGVFWRNVNKDNYKLLESDIQTGTDFCRLPYDDKSIDLLILDPPYMHGGAGVKASINQCYHNKITGHESIIRLYGKGIIEAARVLRKMGRIFVKCQDEIEGGRQRLSHVEILEMLELFGFRCLDIFVLLQTSIPAMRVDYQKSARKNHSYMIVGEFRK